MEDRDIDIGKVLDSLLDESTQQDIELKFLVEAIADKLSRRQAIILRLIIMDRKMKQTEISKLLGYSTPTINLELQKIKEIVKKLLKEEGLNYLFNKKKLNNKKK